MNGERIPNEPLGFIGVVIKQAVTFCDCICRTLDLISSSSTERKLPSLHYNVYMYTNMYIIEN